MKKLLSYFIAMILTLSLAFVAFACDKEEQEEENVVTGQFKYELVTEKRDNLEKPELDDDGKEVKDDLGNTVYEKKDYKFYKITGFTVSSDDATKIANGDFSTVSKYREITIPTVYTELEGATENYPVEEIGMSALASQAIFTKITVGDNIKKIGEGAFAGCSNLKELSLPFIGNELTAVNELKLFGYIFSDSVTENATAVTGKLHQRVDASGTVISSEEDITFNVPTSLEKVIIRNETEIKECAFYGMTMLKEVVLPSALTNIANHAFFGCASLLKMDIPNTVTEIGDYAFSGATSLYKVNYDIENSELTTIGAHAFDGCALLNSSYVQDKVVLKLPKKVATIGEYAFSGCTSIKEIDFTNLTLNVYETGVFKGCTALTKVNVNKVNGVVFKIGAFNGCALLEADGVLNNGAEFNFDGINPDVFDFDLPIKV